MGKSRRRSVSTRTRFNVLKRDQFTCRYCGRGAPDVVLHIDHVRPVADGGGNEPRNLVTACRDCNLGKGAIPLLDGPSGPPAEVPIPYLECDYCGGEIETAQHGLLRWDGRRVPVSGSQLRTPHCMLAHKTFAHPAQCDRALTAKLGRSSSHELLWLLRDGVVPRMLYLLQVSPGIPQDQWRDVFMRLSIPGFQMAKPYLPAYLREHELPRLDQEVARIDAALCRDAVRWAHEEGR